MTSVVLIALLAATASAQEYRSVVQGQLDIPEDGATTATLNKHDLATLPGAVDRDVTNALRVLPGVTADALGQNHYRGNYADVRTWLDGVPLPAGLSNQLLALIPTEVVGKSELIIGTIPAELDGVVGALLLQTSLPATGQRGWAKLTYGTYGTLRPAVAYAATFGRVSVLVSGSYLQTDRGLDPPTPRSLLDDSMRSGQALAKLIYRMTIRDSLDVTFAYRLAHQHVPIDGSLQPQSDAPPGASRGPDAYGNEPTRFVPHDARPTQAERDAFASAAYRHHFAGGGELLAALTYRDSEADLACDATRALGATADPGSSCSDIAHHTQAGGALLHFTTPLGRRHLLKVGLRMEDTESTIGYAQYTRDDARASGGPDAGLTISGRDRSNVVAIGVFAEDRVVLGKVSLLYGVRYDQKVVHIGGGPTQHFEMPSARIGLVYVPRRWITLHVSAGLLWQAPSTDGPTAARALGLVPAGQPVPYDFKAEQTYTAELGLALSPLPWLSGHVTGWGRWSVHPIDDEEVGNTDLKAEYNYRRGGAAGIELGVKLHFERRFSAFANASLQRAAGQDFTSARYLFAADQLAYKGWQTFDHQQVATANIGLDLQTKDDRSHADVLLQYGSGLRTGNNNEHSLPPHITLDAMLWHRFDVPSQPELAVDVLNVLDNRYAYRIANASVIGSAYAPGRQFDLRLVLHI
ncbi:MAG: TonB-dependent receptor [Polyangia bacterium]